MLQKNKKIKKQEMNKGAFPWFQTAKWRLEILLVSGLTLNTEPVDEINSSVCITWERKGDCEFRSHLETVKITFPLW